MKKKKQPVAALKLDLSYGVLPVGHAFVRPDGFDPRVFPWRLRDASVEEAYSAYLLDKLAADSRMRLMDELWRVLVPGGKCTIIVPYWTSARSIQDPLSQWPPLCEQSFLYFNRKFREDNRLDLPMRCDFDFVYGYTLDQETTLRPDDVRSFWIRHYCNSIQDLQLVLTKRP